MQTEYFGVGSIGAVKKIATRLKARKILLVTGKHSFTTSGAESALYRDLAHLKIKRFSDFNINPCLEDGCRGIRLLQSFQPELVIAVGGGSVIDMGKLITILSAQSHEDYLSIVNKSTITQKGIPLVAIPTTAGSGSEATHFCVTYVQDKKSSLAHPFILPDYAIVDPELTFSANQLQTAISGMDGLCQAVESFWSVHSTGLSRDWATKSINHILDSLEDAVLFGSEEAKQKMAYGAHYAGKAINITKTTAPHALSYTLTSRYSIPHGHAVALLLGKFFLINDAYKDALVDHRGEQFFAEICASLYAMFGCKDARSCAESWYRRMETCGLETDLNLLGITNHKDHELILKNLNPERLVNHPIRLTREILAQLFLPG